MLRVGVIGQSGHIPENMYQLAQALGQEIARIGGLLFTGGTSGVMEAASKGASEAGGIVVGILPEDDPEAGNPYITVPVTTGLTGDYRSLVLIHSCDGLIMVGGGNGTLGELSAAYLNNKPVVIVEPSGGWAERVRQIAFDGCYLDHRRTMKLEFAGDVSQAVEMLLSCIKACRLKASNQKYNAGQDDTERQAGRDE